MSTQTGEAQPCGINLVVLDVDVKGDKSGNKSLRGLQDKHQPIHTVRTQTPSGGQHLFLTYPDGANIRNSVSKVGEGLDIRADGGWVAVPPSSVGGTSYHFQNRFAVSEIAATPAWLFALIRYEPKTRNGRAPDDNDLPDVEEVREALSYIPPRPDYPRWIKIITATLDALDGDVHAAERVLKGWSPEENSGEYKEKLRHPLDEVTYRTLFWVARRHGYQPEREKRDFNKTDLGNAERMVGEHGDDLRYCYPRKKWLTYTGTHWEEDANGEAMRRAKATVRGMRQEAASLDDKDEREALWKHARKSEHRARLSAMVKLARSEIGVPVLPEDLDRDPWLFNVENCTIDLRHGRVHEHTKGDLITKIAPVLYDRDADCPRWERHLSEVFQGDGALIRYFQKAVGYSMTGSTEEQCVFLLWGAGANGKGTTVNTIHYVLGAYAQAARPHLLMRKRTTSGPSEAEAALRGARFVSTSETSSGQKLDEATVKRLTGGDRIRARFLRANEFEFEPTHKIWLATNHKPVIEDTDFAIWRRIHLIPFRRTFAKEEQDRKLEEKLQREAPGILNWMLEGCQKWRREGLDQPKPVRDATARYRSEMDIIGAFLDECCVMKDRADVQASTLYKAYVNWCMQSGEKEETQRTFGLRMTERGYQRKRRNDGYYYLGIGLKTDRQNEPPF